MLASNFVGLICWTSVVWSLGQKRIISFTDGSLQLAGGSTVASLFLSTADFSGVIRAGQDLSADFGRITGKNLTIINKDQKSTDTSPTSGPVIIAGTIGKSTLINSLIADGKIDVLSTKGKWESFQSQVVANPMPGLASALVIAGSDKRGTIYGIYDISEQIGVSPWYWWADVAPTQQSKIFALADSKIQGPPSVKYRGIFLNDEQPALTNWVKEKYGGVGYVSGFYVRVFELLLRLRANYLWPTMWDSMFAVDDSKSQRLADEYGIVMGTSHTEPLMRATKEQQTQMSGMWDWASNKNNVIKFLTDGVKRAKPYESLYTMGMRGSADTASSTLNAERLADVVSNQQKILTSVLGGNLSDIPQMWCLYKEVGGYYQKGLRVPDDITLLWSDDNVGNMQRLPITSELGRAGGAGVYYHFDYVGDPRNYKWINTISPQKTWEQMHMTFAREARQIWIVNVGDLKPLYQKPESVGVWEAQWAAREFGAALSPAMASIIDRYGRYAARRKYELLDASIFSIVNYNEGDIVLKEWEAIVADAQKIYDSLPAAAQPGFFELVLHPCRAGYIVYQLYISTAKNNLYAKQGRVSAAAYGAASVSAYAQDSALAREYHKLLGGKWNHMMDQTHIGYTNWQQPASNSMPAQQYPAKNTNSPPGVYVDGGSSTFALPGMDPYSPTSWIDIYSKSNTTTKFVISSDPWILATPSSGQLTPPGLTSDQRIIISVDWKTAPAGTSTSKIIVNTGGTNTTVTVPLRNTNVLAGFTGFVESDKTISIEPEHYSSATSSSTASYGIIPGYGRTLSGVTLFPVTISTQTPPSSPQLAYNIFIFTATTASIRIYCGPSLNTDPSRPLAYAISLDDGAPVKSQYIPVTDLGTLPSTWMEGVKYQGYGAVTKMAVTAGAHVLNLWALEPGVVFQKIVVDLGGVRTSYLGPPESARV
ncbi:glycoside hydrolase family 115 protein [Cadophora sp. DSE1049]|nr:glycoside hydrolase family 115 protein [Cadophora sp. DSE1049]